MNNETSLNESINQATLLAVRYLHSEVTKTNTQIKQLNTYAHRLDTATSLAIISGTVTVYILVKDIKKLNKEVEELKRMKGE